MSKEKPISGVDFKGRVDRLFDARMRKRLDLLNFSDINNEENLSSLILQRREPIFFSDSEGEIFLVVPSYGRQWSDEVRRLKEEELMIDIVINFGYLEVDFDTGAATPLYDVNSDAEVAIYRGSVIDWKFRALLEEKIEEIELSL